MEERLFGTDGIRGIPGQYPLVPDLLSSLGEIAARLLPKQKFFHANGSGPILLMGRDTRSSGSSIARDLSLGLAASNARVIDCGVIPTAAISYLVSLLKAAGGIVISASHNPAEFNGIKFFDSRGLKIDLALERLIEREIAQKKSRRLAGRLVLEDGRGLANDYLDFLRSVFPATMDLSGKTLVLDAANGSASKIARRFFEALGARVYCLGVSPDGRNINRGCGALETAALREMVLLRRADVGIAFDGDADRAVFCDEKGVIRDGDFILGIAALRMKRLGILAKDRVVLTVMSNIGFHKFLNERGISTLTVGVGDRHVTEALEIENLSLGGEPSGHIVLRPFLKTGDGLLTSVLTLAAWVEQGQVFSRMLPGFRPFPQIIDNVKIRSRVPLDSLDHFQRTLRRWEDSLRGDGRIFVRYSGTEPLLRIMVECPSQSRAKAIAQSLTAAYRKEVKETVHDQK